MTFPIVSVVLSVYNGDRYIRPAIEGVLGQSFADFEFLIADDSSTDSTWDILNQYAIQDGRIQLRRNDKNLGVANSINNLFREARGQYVIRHDADDISLPNRFAAQVAYLNQMPDVGLLATYVDIINEDGQPVTDFQFFTTETDNDALQRLLLRDCYLCQGSVMFRRSLLTKAGLYDDYLVPTEDYDLWLRYAECTRLASLNQVHYLYRVHSAGQSRAKFPQQIYAKAIALDRALQRRFTSVPKPDANHIARFYLHAAVAKYDCAETKAGQFSLRRAAQLSTMASQHSPRLFELLVDYTSHRSLAEALALVEQVWTVSVFHADRLKAKLLSQLYMREVFDMAQGKARRANLSYLLKGISYNPVWLLNRGVLAILMKWVLAKLAGRQSIESVGR